MLAIRPPVNLGFGGLTVLTCFTTVRLTRLGVALDVERAARLAVADLVVLVRVRRVVARPFVDVRPRLVDRRVVVELLRRELVRLDERERERPRERRRAKIKPPRSYG